MKIIAKISTMENICVDRNERYLVALELLLNKKEMHELLEKIKMNIISVEI